MKEFKGSKNRSYSLWMAFLLSLVLYGCGREQAQSPFPPTVISVTPANLAVSVPLNAVLTATFSSVMAPASINTSTFTVTTPGGIAVAGAVTLSGATATFTPSITLLADTRYAATITTGAQDPGGNALAANFVWSFQTTDPAVLSILPANNATGVGINTAIAATFNTTMNPATINPLTFLVTGPGATPVAGAITYAGVTATFTPVALLAAGTSYTVTITTAAMDTMGNPLAANFVSTFATSAPPTVVSNVPANGATAVALNTPVSATFSRAMDPASITPATFTLTGPGVTPVAGAVSYAGTTATFTPNALLTGNTLYTATITTGAADPTGNALAANFVWTFNTGYPPSVTSTNPFGGATNVPLNQKITASFNQSMNATTITAAGTFTLAITAGAVPVAGVATYDAASNTAIFTPTANLAPSTQFTATVTSAAQNTGNTPMAANYAWNFTTGTVLDTTAPTVAATDPVDSATAVPLNQIIAATFSEAMDPATISALGTVSVVKTIGATPVPGVVTYETSSHTAIFTPTANLAANTEYTVTISAVAKDLAGNALVAGTLPNPWSFTTGATLNNVAPTITLTNPANGISGVPLNQGISATFSAPMDPTTINNLSFTLAVAGIGGATVDGTVSYNAASQIAVFTPAANLAPSTQYTATISSTVKDLGGNPLAAGLVPNPWSFTTGLTGSAVPPTVNLGAASAFGAIGGGAGVTNQGILTTINGSLGTTGVSTSVTGFHDAGPGCTYTETVLNSGMVNGNIYTAPPPPTVGCPSEGTGVTFAIATQALSDATAAYIAISPAALPGGTDPGAGQLGGLTLFPAVYKSAGGSFLITGSDLTLDAQGDPNAVWVFQMASSLTVGAPGAPRNIILINGAQAKNVYWQVGSFATINMAGGGTMVGTIIASAGVTFSTPGNVTIATLNGRALGLNASVTMVNTNINVPAP